MLLLKQDRLSLLEHKLDKLDQEESRDLYLGRSRNDKNLERVTTLAEIDSCLMDYGNYSGLMISNLPKIVTWLLR